MTTGRTTAHQRESVRRVEAGAEVGAEKGKSHKILALRLAITSKIFIQILNLINLVSINTNQLILILRISRQLQLSKGLDCMQLQYLNTVQVARTKIMIQKVILQLKTRAFALCNL